MDTHRMYVALEYLPYFTVCSATAVEYLPNERGSSSLRRSMHQFTNTLVVHTQALSRGPSMGRSTGELPALQCVRSLPSRPPHIAIFMADDLGFHDVSYAGSSVVSTPHLDALARKGTVLTQFRAPTWCAPSRASFLTGRHGWEVGVAAAFGWTALGKDSLLLPAVLRELGYRTAVVGKFHLNPRTCVRHFAVGGPFGCGFDAQYGFVGGMSDYYDHHRTWSRDGRRLREQGYATELFAAEAERLIHAHASGAYANRSLFLWLSLTAPHVPLQAPAAWVDKQKRHLPPSVRTYAAMVGCMDDAFGRAVEAFRSTGMLHSSLIVFASDNGGPIIPVVCNGGLRGGKGSPYDGGLRAPAFVYWPACLGRELRRVSKVPAHMVDLFATIVVAASTGQQPAQQQRLIARVRKKAPHSISLWGALAGGNGVGGHGSSGGGGGGGSSSSGGRRLGTGAGVGGGVNGASAGAGADPPEFARRQLVLQVSASSSAVMRGRWKLVLANTRCFGTDPALSHELTIHGFKSDRWLLSRLADALLGNQNASAASGARAASRWAALQGSGRLHAARSAGVELQLYDVHSDPAEAHDLLAADTAHDGASGASMLGGALSTGTLVHRNATSIASALLGHYLTAARYGRRNIERAYAEGRVERGSARGWEMVIWFCRQVDFSWTAGRWRDAAQMMCQGRSQPERRRLTAVPLAFDRASMEHGQRKSAATGLSRPHSTSRARARQGMHAAARSDTAAAGA